MRASRFFLGIDGGGTRTAAWLANERGRVVARAVSGPSNPLKVGFEACQREILRAARAVLHKSRITQFVAPDFSPAIEKHAGLKPGSTKVSTKASLEAVVIGLAGVDRPQIHAPVLKWMEKNLPARRHLLTSDAAIALHAAIGNSPGLMVISGTGSIAFARDEKGQEHRSGGWGAAYDDLGSGYDLGRRAIIAALRDYDGRGHSTTLGRKICRALQLRDITHIVLRTLTTHETAALSPLVLQAARQGDAVARLMVDVAAQDLSDLAMALIDRLGWSRQAIPVVCAGGIFSASRRLRKLFSLFVRNAAPHARVLMLRKEPVEGALAMARELALEAADAEPHPTHKK